MTKRNTGWMWLARAVVAIAVVLSAVFIPTAFVREITGQFYRQFALDNKRADNSQSGMKSENDRITS